MSDKTEELMNRLESLEKAFTENPIAAGTDWQNAVATDANSLRGQIDTAGGSAEAVLTDAERRFIIDRVVDESSLLKVVRKLTMNRSRVEIPRMSLGTRVMRAQAAGGHPEYDQAGNEYDTSPPGVVTPDFETVILTASKLVLPWVITNEFLEDNPEQGAAERRIATIMATQAANDLEDLALNGDEGSADALLKADDGYLIQAAGAGGNVVAALGNFTTDTLESILRGLPTKYRRNLSQLRYLVHPDTWMDYVQSIAARQGNMADQYLAGLVSDPTYGGIPLMSSPFMPTPVGGAGQILLTHPDNLLFGVERELKMSSTKEGRQALWSDVRFYAMHIRADFVIQNVEATALGTDVDVRVP